MTNLSTRLNYTRNSMAVFGATLLATLISGCTDVEPQQESPAADPDRGWLFALPNEEERIEALQNQLRGTDVAMWEIGMRYEGLYDAISRENYDLALYHWEKIRQSTENALQRRPLRRPSAEALFLDSTWEEVHAAIETRNQAEAWGAFEQARTACMVCHDAENLSEMNNMAMFDLRSPTP